MARFSSTRASFHASNRYEITRTWITRFSVKVSARLSGYGSARIVESFGARPRSYSFRFSKSYHFLFFEGPRSLSTRSLIFESISFRVQVSPAFAKFIGKSFLNRRKRGEFAWNIVRKNRVPVSKQHRGSYCSTLVDKCQTYSLLGHEFADSLQPRKRDYFEFDEARTREFLSKRFRPRFRILRPQLLSFCDKFSLFNHIIF